MPPADPDLVALLAAASLGEMAERLAAQGIDAKALRDLDEEGLRALGLSLGQRKRLLQQLRPQESNIAVHPGTEAATLAVAAVEEALQRSETAAAAGMVQTAETALERVEDAHAADRLRLRLLIARSSISRIQQGIASDDAGRLGKQVLELAGRLRETRAELMALTGLYTHALVRAEYFVAGKWAELLSERAEQAQDDTFRMIGRRGTGVVALHLGDFTRATMALQETLDSYDETRHLPLAYAHGYDHAEICSAFLSFALWITGDPKGGAEASVFSVAHSRRIGHMHSLAQSLVFRAMLMALAHDWEACRAAAVEGEEVGRRHGLPVMGTACGFFSHAADLAARAAPPNEAELRALRQAHAAFRRVNPYNYQQLCGVLLAMLHVRSGALAEAEEALNQAEAVQARTRETFLAPELLRTRAVILAARGDIAGAATKRAAAFEAADRMGARMFALRIACDKAEAAPSAAARERLAAARAQLASEDDGEDVRRCVALMRD